MPCDRFDDLTVAGFAEGRLSGALRTRFEAHLETCRECVRRVLDARKDAWFLRGFTSAPGAPWAPFRVLLSLVGRALSPTGLRLSVDESTGITDFRSLVPAAVRGTAPAAVEWRHPAARLRLLPTEAQRYRLEVLPIRDANITAVRISAGPKNAREYALGARTSVVYDGRAGERLRLECRRGTEWIPLGEVRVASSRSRGSRAR